MMKAKFLSGMRLPLIQTAMKYINASILYALVGVITIVCLTSGALKLHAAVSSPSKKILLLNSYHAGYKGSDDIVTGFSETLKTSFPDAEIVIEYLDSKHFSGPEFDNRVFDMLSFKYRKQPYDLIVSADDYAFNVLEQHRDQLFGQTPVVFCGTNYFDKKRIKDRPDFVGIDESPSFDETLELVFNLHPDTKEIIAIHDDSVTGQLNSAYFLKDTSRFESRAKFSYRNGKRLEELVDEVGQLKPGTVAVYFASFVQDLNGNRHSSVDALNMISKASKVPIYGGWEFNLGYGIVGGRLINLREHGRAAALLASKVLQGESPSHLTALQPSPNAFMFDYTELERFTISESGLPTGSKIINRPPTFFSQYGTALLAVLSATLLLLVVVVFVKLLTSNKHLKQSRIKFSSIVEAFNGLIYVCSSGYRIEYMNEQMITRTGYDATGDFCYKVLHGLDSVCSWCKNDRVFAGENIQWEIKSPKDGRWYSTSNTLVKNADGTVSKQAMITDITERKQAEENVARYSQLLDKTSKIANIGGWELNLETMKLIWSEQVYRIHELSPDTSITVEASIGFYTPESRPVIQDAVRALIESGVPFDLELQINTAMNNLLWVCAQGEADYNEGKIFKIYGTFQDITQRKQAEEEKQTLEQQFQQTQKLESLGVLAGGIAHDFNNILAIIMGYCCLTKMDFADAEKHIPEIEKAAERAAALCRQMLAYAGKAQFIEAQVNTSMLVDEMVTMLRTTIKQNVVIRSELCSDTPFITGDASQIRQIVMNLIINAAEAIDEEQGEIQVSLSKREMKAGQSERDHLGNVILAGQYICLEVTDNGCGMDDETKLKLFEPFYTTKFTGRGLGMSAVLGIIAAHRGALQFTSQPGQGTTFKVYLPVPINDANGVESLQHVTSAVWERSGTLLLVEDEDHVRLIAKTMLQALGFTIIEATNGKEALELYRKNAADITYVFTDMDMPVMDGYALFRELKKLNPELPIIISSGFGEVDVASRIPLDEIAGIINKPYSFDQLRESMRCVVECLKHDQA
jgi:signal transduction histidine kinase/CheY-like chemotaxis protein